MASQNKTNAPNTGEIGAFIGKFGFNAVQCSSGPTPHFGELFYAQDARGGFDCENERRLIHFMPLETGAKESSETSPYDRLGKLTGKALPYVLTPLETIREQYGYFSVYPYWESTICGAIKKANAGGAPLAQRETADWLEQILTGLAALHKKGIAHGDIRPETIALTSIGESTQAWLANVVIGGTAHWTGAKRMARDASEYFPPEWKGNVKAPNLKSDLYSVGVVAAKLAAAITPGQDGGSNNAQRPSRWESFQAYFCGNDTTLALRCLLAAEDDRPGDASKALRQYRRWRRLTAIRWPVMIATITGLILLICGLSWRKQAANARQDEATARISLAERSDQLGKLQTDNENLRKQSESLNVQLTESRTKISRLSEKIDRLTGTERPLVKQAKDIWNQIVIVDDITEDGIAVSPRYPLWEKQWSEHIETRINQLQSGQLPESQNTESSESDRDELAKQLKSWLEDGKRVLFSTPLHWRPSSNGENDDELKRLWQFALGNPWNQDYASQLLSRVNALNKAANQWGQWADDSTLTIGDLRGRIETFPESPEQSKASKEILRAWYQAFVNKKDWAICFSKASAPKGFGKYRGVSVKCGSKWAETQIWDYWTSETNHDYGSEAINFRWNAGDPVVVAVEGERTAWRAFYRPYQIYKEFSGPLAIWLVYRHGVVQQDDFAIYLNVPNCPGPPREHFLSGSAEKLATDFLGQ